MAALAALAAVTIITLTTVYAGRAAEKRKSSDGTVTQGHQDSSKKCKSTSGIIEPEAHPMMAAANPGLGQILDKDAGIGPQDSGTFEGLAAESLPTGDVQLSSAGMAPSQHAVPPALVLGPSQQAASTSAKATQAAALQANTQLDEVTLMVEGESAQGTSTTRHVGRPPVANRTKASIEGLLAALRKQGLQTTSAFGRRDGSWVRDETILEVLQFLETDAAQGLACHGESYDIRACYLNTSSGQVLFPDADTDELPQSNMLLLVVHLADADEETSTHFSLMIANKRLKLVHAFDTISKWSGEKAGMQCM